MNNDTSLATALEVKSLRDVRRLFEALEVKLRDRIAVYNFPARQFRIRVVEDLQLDDVVSGSNPFVWAKFGVKRCSGLVDIIGFDARIEWPHYYTSASEPRLDIDGSAGPSYDRKPEPRSRRLSAAVPKHGTSRQGSQDIIDLTNDSD
ncbi:hypothetical protein PsYK624_067150 [Phanerochaete sordida]|uniref:Uncharacterized protein n=1 Tax=Phanerochaete sordida TaxID=48140 RepID=A0A9P3G9L6_9APHY|nr:hypothetical protein PsYK624_067150 [Phanerochaete sordida]